MLRPPTKGPNKMREHLRVDTSISTETLERDLRIAEEEANAEAADEVGRGSSRWNTEQPQAGPSRISSRPDQPDQPAKKRGRGKAPKVQTPEPPEEPPEAPDLEDVAPPPPSAGPSGLTFVTINPHTGKKVGRPKRTPASERTTSGAPEKVVITDGAELDGLDLDKLSANIRSKSRLFASDSVFDDPFSRDHCRSPACPRIRSIAHARQHRVLGKGDQTDQGRTTDQRARESRWERESGQGQHEEAAKDLRGDGKACLHNWRRRSGRGHAAGGGREEGCRECSCR